MSIDAPVDGIRSAPDTTPTQVKIPGHFADLDSGLTGYGLFAKIVGEFDKQKMREQAEVAKDKLISAIKIAGDESTANFEDTIEGASQNATTLGNDLLLYGLTATKTAFIAMNGIDTPQQIKNLPTTDKERLAIILGGAAMARESEINPENISILPEDVINGRHDIHTKLQDPVGKVYMRGSIKGIVTSAHNAATKAGIDALIHEALLEQMPSLEPYEIATFINHITGLELTPDERHQLPFLETLGGFFPTSDDLFAELSKLERRPDINTFADAFSLNSNSAVSFFKDTMEGVAINPVMVGSTLRYIYGLSDQEFARIEGNIKKISELAPKLTVRMISYLLKGIKLDTQEDPITIQIQEELNAIRTVISGEKLTQGRRRLMVFPTLREELK